jgi:acyl carrier protein
LECLGRIDLQVKISGNRIALNEIEAVLKQHAAVVDAAVAVIENAPGHKSLIGYVLQRSGVDVAPAQLREFLEERVPEYMVPKIVNVTSLPHTPTGKVDRIALSRLHHAFVDDHSSFAKAESETEKTLANIWSSVLGRSGLSAETNFIDLGGDSLYAARCIARVRSAFGIDLPFTVLFEESGSVRSIARLVDEMRHS